MIAALTRVRPGVKLIALMAVSVLVLSVPQAKLWSFAGAVLVVAVAGLSDRSFAKRCLRVLWVFAPAAVLLCAYQWWQHTPLAAAETVGGLLALILFATLVTESTPVDEMTDTLVWAMSPLRVCGVSPEYVGLAVSLAIRSLPVAAQLAHDTREAARARGLERNPRALVLPFVLRMVAHSQRAGEALHARGVL